MLFLDGGSATCEYNLALEESLLEQCDRGGPEILMLWKPQSPCVVVGYAQSVRREVDAAACAADGIPVLRRITGGGTVYHDAGALCYSVVLRSSRAEIANVGAANCWIMGRQRDIVRSVVDSRNSNAVAISGDSDLTLNGRKFSGNAQRRKIRAILFHGTFLLNADANAMERYLRFPSRQPEYRANRGHADFVTVLPVDEANLRRELRAHWDAAEPLESHVVPNSRALQLVAEKYGRPEWNLKM